MDTDADTDIKKISITNDEKISITLTFIRNDHPVYDIENHLLLPEFDVDMKTDRIGTAGRGYEHGFDT